MRTIYTGTQVRTAEKVYLDAGHGPELMRKAAWGLAHHTIGLLRDRGRVYGARVTGLVGKGNNGGDTLWALSFLAKRGVAITAIAINTTADQLHSQGLAAFEQAGGKIVTTIHPTTAAVIDGVFGTGFDGSFDLPQYLRDHHLNIPNFAGVIACDIPSGVVADTGVVHGAALPADTTVTFGANKYGLVAGAGGQHSGTVHVTDIGLTEALEEVDTPWHMVDDHDLATVFGPPPWDDHKYSRGVLSVVAGSAQYPGAAVLVVSAAAATGTGFLSFVAEPPRGRSVGDKVLAATPQAVVEDSVAEKATALIVGPGLGDTVRDHDVAGSALQTAIHQQLPVLVDATGMDILDEQVLSRQLPAMVLTPHIGEMQRLTSRLAPDLEDHPVTEQAQVFAQRFGVWVVLKSSDTYVFAPHGARSIHPSQTSELATAGTGDTLAGILGAAMSSLDPDADDFADQLLLTLSAGVRLHSVAGELAAAEGGVEVSSLQAYIRTAKQQCRTHPGVLE